jgi:hypothetical protein
MVYSLGRLARAAGLLALLPGLAAAGIAPARHVPPAPARVADPNPGLRNDLYGVTALSPTDVWAVGYDCTAKCGTSAETDRTLIEHWDGTGWSQVTSPDPGTAVDKLFAVTAASATDAWAVGYDCSLNCHRAGERERTLVLHWNGTAWDQVASPNPFPDELTAVTATSATDAWAVGYYCTTGCLGSSGTNGTLIEHWNGTAWTHVSSPDPGASPKSDYLFGAAATGPDGAWAGGSYCAANCFTPNEVDKNLILRWNGTAWSKVTSPNPGKGQPFVTAMSADSPTDAWAAGWSLPDNGPQKTMLLHWNGSAWSKVTAPSPGNSIILNGLSAQSPTDVWATGVNEDPASGAQQTFTVHWDGTAWQQVTSPSPGLPPNPATNYLRQVSADSPTDAWAVGSYCSSHCAENSERDKTLILHWNGTAWSVS